MSLEYKEIHYPPLVYFPAPITPLAGWAGSKRSMLPTLARHLPPPERRKRYVEPFFGGGALFFFHQPEKAHLNDTNHRLMTVYTGLRDSLEDTLRHLRVHAEKDSETHYYTVRDEIQNDTLTGVELAAAVLYVIRQSYGGIWRENQQGHITTSYRRQGRAVVRETITRRVSAALQGTVLTSADFAAIEPHSGDFWFLDPPYLDSRNIYYTPARFGWVDMGRLAAHCDRIDTAGGLFCLTHTDSDDIRALFSGWRIDSLEVPRCLGAPSNAREVIVRNW